MKRWYLYPISVIYHAVTALRNKAFGVGILSSQKMQIPTIGVGNLSVGGTGKSPVVMYLAQLLHKNKRTGVLSRGYGRSSKGFKLLNYSTRYEQVGDEAFQLFHRLKNKIVVVVCENRVIGARRMIKDLGVECLILDDNMQHRYLSVGFQIMLTEYKDPYFKDFVLPAGDLRESRHGVSRANIILITKCPNNLTEEKKVYYRNQINPNSGQHVFFSSIEYNEKLMSHDKFIPIQNLEYYEVLLITGIANPHYIYNQVAHYSQKIIHKKFGDHHNFTKENIENIIETYKKMGDYKLLLCTEKDYVRLKHIDFFKEKLYYWPIDIKIDCKKEFNDLILNYVK